MLDSLDPGDRLLVAVCHVLDAVDSCAGALPVEHRNEFAFNVLLNSLSSVLERIRADDPDARATYARVTALLLNED